ncbi:hypothetical protein K1719_002536 [Acacia pycnantha]|nr:hypothetical protein K1719_002536 [Acacia pycnantha]
MAIRGRNSAESQKRRKRTPTDRVMKKLKEEEDSLRFNALTGSLPSDLASCVHLRNLYLQRNLFSGEIHEFLFSGEILELLFSLLDMVCLNLAHNNFSGAFPLDFNKLVRLRILYLENNQLSGNSLCGKPLKLCPGEGTAISPSGEIETNNNNGGKKKKLFGGSIAGI